MSTSQAYTPKRSRSFWLEHTEQWKQSALSKIAYCQKHNLKPASFYNWSKKLENDVTESSQELQALASTTFLPVQLEPVAAKTRNTAEFVHVERAATEVALPVDLSGEQIQHWLQAIHALHV